MNFENMSKEELIEYIKNLNEDHNGKYGIVWDLEKVPEQIVVDCNKYIPVLKEVEDKKIDNGGNDNILIEGDNFHSLSVLNYTHKESVDVIYIDPPYNTGNKDFTYNDKFVDVEDGYRHSKWLNFMSKRLKLAKDLLKKDGVIFISIDDNEQAQLKLLCDKIFNANNYLGTMIQNKGNAQNDATDIQKNHEYILCYRRTKRIEKGKVIATLNNTKVKEKNIFEDKYGYYYKGSAIVTGGEGGTLNRRPNLGYTIYFNKKTSDFLAVEDYNKELARVSNDEKEVYTDRTDLIERGYDIIRAPKKGDLLGCWTWNAEKFNNEKSKILITKTKNAYSVIKKEYVPKELVVKKDGLLKYYENSKSNSKSILDFSTVQGTNELTKVLGKGKMFNNPKNISMIKYLILLHLNYNATILDFFAGSGTTAQAVLELNKEDGGNRKFILCTNNENNICEDITYQRINTVITGRRKDGSVYSEGLPGSLKYFKTDFVENNSTRDQIYFDLTEKCISMLCVKESTFDLIYKNDSYVIYTDKQKENYTCIYYDIYYKNYNDFLNKIREIKNQKSLYIFSLDNRVEEYELEGITNYKVEAIPQKIYDLYKKLVKLSKEN